MRYEQLPAKIRERLDKLTAKSPHRAELRRVVLDAFKAGHVLAEHAEQLNVGRRRKP